MNNDEKRGFAMTDEQKNEEAHGLWELAVARVAAVAEAICAAGTLSDSGVSRLLDAAVNAERAAFANWQQVSGRVTAR